VCDPCPARHQGGRPPERARGAKYTDAPPSGTMAVVQIERQNFPAVVAHRGASAVYPENTLESFQGAIDAGADAVELDVRMTLDGVPVIMHDLDVSTTTGGAGLVHQLTLAEIKALDASRGRGPRTEVPTLAEGLDLLSGRAGVNVEVKNLPGEPTFDSPKEAAAEAVVRLLNERGFDGSVLVCSFNWLSIERVREMDAGIATGFLTTALIEPWAALVYVKSQGHRYVLPQAPALLAAGPPFVEAAHADGILVGTWTVDDPDAIRQLFEMGVDAVATNDPAKAIPIRDLFRG
jgi:glycerophosphoryl diester phosphodiesterase